MEYILKNEQLEIVFSSLGAEMVSVKCNGKERLWQNDNNTWTGHAPVLFPFPGRCLFDYEGKEYPMNQHGLARRMEFELIGKKEDSIRFLLKANEQSKSLYPFDFAFELVYSIRATAVEVKYIVKNNDDKPMPFSIGCHDSYAIEKDVTHYAVVFENEEHFQSLKHTSDGHLPGTCIDLGIGTSIALDSPLLENGGSIILKDIHSRKTTLIDLDTQKAIASVTFPGFNNYLLWHPPLSKMICMEPWHSLSDSEPKQGSFLDKDGVMILNKGEQKEFTHTIDYIG